MTEKGPPLYIACPQPPRRENWVERRLFPDDNAPATFNEFTRWRCPACGKAGVDSWHKAAFDGLKWGEDGPPETLGAFGAYCQVCPALLVVHYQSRTDAPRCIVVCDTPAEEAAFAAFGRNPMAGIALQPSTCLDVDWSRGCLAAKAQSTSADRAKSVQPDRSTDPNTDATD